MATLRRDSDGLEQVLSADSVVGRGVDCLVQLRDRTASTRHAAIRWTGEQWELRDLGSRNGTMLRGARLEPGQPAMLWIGQAMVFGGPEERWTLVDAAPPVPCAFCLDAPGRVVVVDGYITLPSAEVPEVLVYAHPQLGWLVEGADGEVNAATHGQLVVAGGRGFRLELTGSDPTLAARPSSRSLRDATMRFRVSTDEEHVDAELVWPETEFQLPASVHWYIALQLARTRLAEEEAGELPDWERGWVDRETFCHSLRISSRKLSVDLHRLRQYLSRVGVEDGATLFERRATNGQLRLGIAAVEIL